MAANPVVQTYFLHSSAGALRRYCASCALALGAALPLVAPLLALGLFNPWVNLLFEVSTVITPLSPCYNTAAPTVCPGASRVAYYFWNISNADQARGLYSAASELCDCQCAACAPCILQWQKSRRLRAPVHAVLTYPTACSGLMGWHGPHFRRSAPTASRHAYGTGCCF